MPNPLISLWDRVFQISKIKDYIQLWWKINIHKDQPIVDILRGRNKANHTQFLLISVSLFALLLFTILNGAYSESSLLIKFLSIVLILFSISVFIYLFYGLSNYFSKRKVFFADYFVSICLVVGFFLIYLLILFGGLILGDFSLKAVLLAAARQYIGVFKKFKDLPFHHKIPHLTGEKKSY